MISPTIAPRPRVRCAPRTRSSRWIAAGAGAWRCAPFHRLIALLALLLGIMPLHAPAQAQDLSWSRISPTNRHIAAYDSARGVVVSFGGPSTGGTANETWEWNGASGAWTLRNTPGPVPPINGVMTFDSARAVTVLHAGSQTWEWNGQSWTLRKATGPVLPQFAGKMVFDSARSVSVLFSGTQTWEWDGKAWTQRLVPGPSNRTTHAMAYDAARAVTVLFGGSQGVAAGETWEWNGSIWSQRVVLPPEARYDSAMAYDASRGVVVLYGGRSATTFSDTWEWNGTTWTRRTASGPGERAGHVMVYDAARRVCILVDCAAQEKLWEWNGAGAGSWTQRAGNPRPRSLAGIAYDSDRGVGVLFGGVTHQPTRTIHADTWEWTGTTWLQRAAAGPGAPSPRTAPAMAYDPSRHVTVLFGGSSLTSVSNPAGDDYADTWEWNGSTWTQRIIPGPPGRAGMAMAYDHTRAVMVLTGGWGALGAWEYDGVSWQERATTGLPGSLQGARMVYDPARAVMVLAGGNQHIQDTCWEWDGSTWTTRTAPGPSGRVFPGMVYDPVRAVTSLFGGSRSGPETSYSDSWDWDGTNWTLWTPLGVAPPTRGAHAMFYDSMRDTTVVFAGSYYTFIPANRDDSWALSRPCAAPSFVEEPSPQVGDIGSSITFSAAPAGGGRYLFQWRRNGVNLIDQPGRIRGSTGSRLTLSALALTDAGAYDCVLANPCGTVTSAPASLTLCGADFNTDGVVNSSDFFDFLTAFFAQSPAADTNHDGIVNSQDFFDFLAAFFAGC